jgi:hypothetical protein
MLSLLTECTIQMIQIIHDLYREHRITYDEFYNLTKIKIDFLTDNLHNLSSVERQTVDEIISQCKVSLRQDGGASMKNSFCSCIDILQ